MTHIDSIGTLHLDVCVRHAHARDATSRRRDFKGADSTASLCGWSSSQSGAHNCFEGILPLVVVVPIPGRSWNPVILSVPFVASAAVGKETIVDGDAVRVELQATPGNLKSLFGEEKYQALTTEVEVDAPVINFTPFDPGHL